MKKRIFFLSLPILLCAVWISAADHGIFPADAVRWVNGPPSLPQGSKVAVLEGDPGKEGLFTLRLSVPDGYKIPPHSHPAVEHITVISGTFQIGMGDKFDESNLKPMTAGTFGFLAAKMNHFAMAKGATVIQLHGVGPWEINYVNPADDPREK
jgi:hypothetical protein